MMFIALVSLSILVFVQGSCDNHCSGHGSCGEQGICTCYDNWGLGLAHYSGDCSQRICPYEVAWVDKPNVYGTHHNFAECAGRGICNRDTAECECFPGYEGKGCQRTTCPNDCSGHGQCKYIEDLGYATVPFDLRPKDGGLFDFLNQDTNTFSYYYWDSKKTRGCVCDPQYGDVDCSKRMCPYGTDVMDQRLDLTSPAKYQTQAIKIEPYQSKLVDHTLDVLADQTFALTFTSRLNETFTTIPLVFNAAVDKHSMSLSIKRALESLPNYVIDQVNVEVNVDTSYGTSSARLNISFTGDAVQGPQHLITVRSYECGDGCTPKLTGMELEVNTNNVTEVLLSDFNSYECGRRGKCDYDSGICQCFSGYTGVNCNIITSLV